MKRWVAISAAAIVLLPLVLESTASAYLIDTTVPQEGGCPQPQRWNLSLAAPLNRRWSTSLAVSPATVVTAAASATAAQLDEIERAISDSFGAWSGVAASAMNATKYPGVLAPLARTASANACSNDQESNIDGLNTICFNQSLHQRLSHRCAGLHARDPENTNFNPRSLPASP